jgi:hypothetical protein
MILFGAACLIPTVVWHGMALLSEDTSANVISVVRHDPTLLRGSKISSLFSFLGGFWQGITVPLLTFGVLGMLRAHIAQRGREWLPVLLLHLAALTAALAMTNQGTQPRYMILTGSILAAYSGVFIGAVYEASRPRGSLVMVFSGLLLGITPQMFPGGHDLWIRRNAPLREVVDTVRASCGNGSAAVEPKNPPCNVLWVADESAYFYACRVRPPIDSYHALSREDSDPNTVLDELKTADLVVAGVRQSAPAQGQWDRFVRCAADEWSIQVVAQGHHDYQVFRLRRLHPHP